MFEPGNYICPHCKARDTMAYYRNRDRKNGVKLTHQLERKYLKRTMTFNVVSDGEDETVRLAEPLPADCDGMPAQIKVFFEDEETETVLHRACPVCGLPLPHDLGRYKTAVIAVTGEPGSGKSSWLGAVASLTNIQVFNNAGFPVYIEFNKVNAGKGIDVSTGIESVGNTVSFSIKEKKTKKIIASVLLMDAAGESYRRESDKFWNDLREATDAVLFVENLSTAVTEEDNPDARAFNNIKQHGLSDKILAYVGTHADLLLTMPQVLIEKTSKKPLFSKMTFRQDYAPIAGCERFLLHKHILRRLGIPMVNDPSFNAGFLVQSCTSDGKQNSYGAIMNVYDPLIFVLNQIGILSIT